MAQAKTAARKPRRKEKKNIALGQAHIKSTFNNTVPSWHPGYRTFADASNGLPGRTQHPWRKLNTSPTARVI
jgi:hypothetical protein